jgi:NAD(P)H-hydrate repair Nnr-like enzyme with NAD(P)H-hydrate dehydratase domain
MPDAVQKIVAHVLPDAEFAPSNPSGSFSKQALDSFISLAQWGDACLLAGDFGRNSETAVLMEDFVQRYNGLLTVTQDAVDYFKTTPRMLLERDNTLIVLSIAQLQKYFIHTPLITPITYGMTQLQLAEALQQLTQKFPACIIVKHQDVIFVAHNGSIVSSADTAEFWRVSTAARASVFWLQHPTKILEASVTSLLKA